MRHGSLEGSLLLPSLVVGLELSIELSVRRLPGAMTPALGSAADGRPRSCRLSCDGRELGGPALKGMGA